MITLIPKQCAFSLLNTNKIKATIYIIINTMVVGTSEQTQIGFYIVLCYNDLYDTNKYMCISGYSVLNWKIIVGIE